ncbi:MAG: hypothetical protein QMD65_00415 [Patescibacteria group bacterium]|nr:hypothetical protein [Patescibacteria group bacterium]
MCDFISWRGIQKDDEKHLFYLTDKEVFSDEGKVKFKDSKDNDVLGHGAINLFFELGGEGSQHEVRDFWNLYMLPGEIAKKIQNFDLHWGKIFASGAFQTDDLEYIIANGPKEWKEKAKKQLLIQEFTLLKTFSLTVPKGYKHKTQLSTLKRKNFHYFNDAVTDKNFRKVTEKLVPGKTYKIKIFRIGGRVTSEECLDLYKRERAILIGVQGLSLVYQFKKKEFLKDKYLFSFDKKKALYKDAGGSHWLPYVYRKSDSDYEEFGLDYFWRTRNVSHCLLLFCDGE